MKCRRKAMDAEVVEYEVGKGLEDGFTPYKDVITTGFVHADNVVKITQEDGVVVCPFVRSKRGCTFISEGDFVIFDADGTKHVCGKKKIWERYERIE